MHDLPVTIRLLDLPLHEFLPKYEELVADVAALKANGKAGAAGFKRADAEEGDNI